MKRVVLACVGLLAFAPVVAIAQERTPPAGSTSSGAAVPRGGEGGGAPSGGSTMTSGGSSNSSGGYSGGGSSWGGGDRSSGGGAYVGGSRGGNRGSGDYNAPASVSRTTRSGESYAAPREMRGTASIGQPVPATVRPRGDGPTYGRAVPRGSVQPKPQPQPGGGGVIDPWGYYPYYPGDPYFSMYGYGPWGYGYSYNPWYSMYGYSYGYSLYNPWGTWSDPYWGGTPTGGYYSRNADQGGIRLKVKPKDAEVWVDGYFEGPVSGYDGVFKSLKLTNGNHRVEIKAKGYETLSFDVRVMPGRTVTYTGDLKAVAAK